MARLYKSSKVSTFGLRTAEANQTGGWPSRRRSSHFIALGSTRLDSDATAE